MRSNRNKGAEAPNPQRIDQAVFDRLATGPVHWAHARLELTTLHPDLPEEELREAYRDALKRAGKDQLSEMVFDPALSIVLGEKHVWLDAKTFEPFNVTKATLERLPACIDIGTSQADNILVERARNGFPLDGYRPVWIVRGPSVFEAPGKITVVVQPPNQDPVRFLEPNEMMPEQDLEELMQEAFPGINLDVTKGIVAAALCAERNGMPTIVHLIGPTGSGKSASALLAGQIMGSPTRTVRIEANTEEWRRQLGTAHMGGSRLLVLDEIARVPNLRRQVRNILQLGSNWGFRLLYRSNDTNIRWGAGLVMTSLTVPPVFATSPELRRRIWATRLPRTVQDWQETAGPGGILAWRGRDPRNALVANTILTMARQLADSHQYRFNDFAEELGFVRPGALTDIVDEEAMRDLYRYAQDLNGDRVMKANSHFGSADWIDGKSQAAAQILDRLTPDDGGAPSTRHNEELELLLEAADWNGVLGIDEPNILCALRVHRRQIVFRFQNDEGSSGRELRNEQLPRIPGDDSDDKAE